MKKLVIANLVISQLIIISFLFLAYFFWYPHSLVGITGFFTSAKMLFFINITLVILISLFVFRKGERLLKLDLSFLIIVQIAALSFGAYNIFQRHPVYAVFTVDRFTLIDARNATPNDAIFDELKVSLLSGPTLVYAKSPTDPSQRKKILLGNLFNGEPDLDGRAEHYEPYNQHIKVIFSKSVTIEKLITNHHEQEILKSFLNKNGGDKNAYVYIPLAHNNNYVVWAIDKKTTKPVDILPIDPWTKLAKTKINTKI